MNSHKLSSSLSSILKLRGICLSSSILSLLRNSVGTSIRLIILKSLRRALPMLIPKRPSNSSLISNKNRHILMKLKPLLQDLELTTMLAREISMSAQYSITEFKNIWKIRRKWIPLCIPLSINLQWTTSSRKINLNTFMSMLCSFWHIQLRNRLLKNRKFSLWPIWVLLSWPLLISITSQNLWNSLCSNL